MEQPLCIVKRFQKKPALQVASDPDASVSSFCEGPHTPLRDQPILTTVDTLDFENILFSSDAGDGQAVDAWSPEVNAAFPPTPPRLHTALQDSLDSGSSGSWNLVRGAPELTSPIRRFSLDEPLASSAECQGFPEAAQVATRRTLNRQPAKGATNPKSRPKCVAPPTKRPSSLHSRDTLGLTPALPRPSLPPARAFVSMPKQAPKPRPVPAARGHYTSDPSQLHGGSATKRLHWSLPAESGGGVSKIRKHSEVHEKQWQKALHVWVELCRFVLLAAGGDLSER